MEDKLITTFNKYKETYQSRLENHLAKYVDYDEFDFVNRELCFYENCLETTSVSEHRIFNPYDDVDGYDYKFLNKIEADEMLDGINWNYRTENYEVKSLIKVGGSFLTDGYNLEKCEQLRISFTKIINFLKELIHIKTIENIEQSSILSEFIKKEPELTSETEIATTKETEHTLFNGKKLNIAERYTIANKIFGFEKTFKTLNISDDEKYKILSYILNCNKDNARHVMNGTYKAKERDLTNYFAKLNLNK